MEYNHKYLKTIAKASEKIKKYSYTKLDNIIGGKILDIGCGDGHDVFELASLGNENEMIVGIDKNKKLIKEANKSLSKTIFKNIKFLNANAESLPFNDNTFDAIRADRVFQHLENPLKTMDEIKRVLKHNGKIVIVETDWCGLSITPNHETTKKLIKYLIYKLLNDGEASRMMPTYFNHAKCKNIQTKIFSSEITSYKTINQFIKLDQIGDKAIKNKLIKRSDYLKWLEEIKKLDFTKKIKCTIDLIVSSANNFKP